MLAHLTIQRKQWGKPTVKSEWANKVSEIIDNGSGKQLSGTLYQKIAESWLRQGSDTNAKM